MCTYIYIYIYIGPLGPEHHPARGAEAVRERQGEREEEAAGIRASEVHK